MFFLFTFLEKPIIQNLNSKQGGLDEKISTKIGEAIMIPCDVFDESAQSNIKVIWSLNGFPVNSNAQGYHIFVSYYKIIIEHLFFIVTFYVFFLRKNLGKKNFFLIL